MKRSRKRRLRMRWALAAVLGMTVALMLSGCFLFNRSPIASFTVSGGLIHATGEVVAFSGILSMDPDNDDLTFRWDFGDGGSGVGEQVTHPYSTTGPMEVVLEVSDPSGATATATKTLTITEGDDDGDGGAGGGPTASFTATPLTGESPLTVNFNASASVYVGHTISAYFWNFGDGVTGTGLTTTHTYAPSTTRSYSVVLRIIADDNTEDTASKTITVTVAGASSPSDAPTASFDPDPRTQVAPLLVAFDPADSDASAGLNLRDFIWTFGDGDGAYRGTDEEVTHRYVTDQAEEEFEVTLRVVDEENNSDTETQTITIENYQPTAGFEIYDVVQDDIAAVPVGGDWIAAGDGEDEIHLDDADADSKTAFIRIQLVPETWWGDDILNPTLQGTATSDPTGFVDENFCFDPEGQGWDDGGDGTLDDPTIPANYPAGWPNAGWGIQTIKIQWGDGVTQYYDYYTDVANGKLGIFSHTYATWPGDTGTPYTIVVTATDFLGGSDSAERTIRLVPVP